ncbi:MAG: hypothetical protein ACR2I8_00520, partial [Steroidobacteraceae bacterium]
VVNQPTLYRVQDGQLYVQSFPPHEEHPEAKAAAKGARFNKQLQGRITQRAQQAGVEVDWALAQNVVNAASGVAIPISPPPTDVAAYLASARLVANALPADANWDGSDRPVPIRGAAGVPVTGRAAPTGSTKATATATASAVGSGGT